MTFYRRFIVTFLVFSASLIVGVCIGGAGSLAQNVDTTIKPLPDFIQNRPVVEVPEATPQKQDDTSDIAAPDDISEPKRSDLSDIPDAYIIEASKYGEECRNTPTLHKYFDCRCMAVKYLDARIEYGPEADKSVVINQLGDDCKDASGIAGELYQECLYDINNAPTHLDPEEYCSCYSNTYAKYYERASGRMEFMRNINLLSRARTTCEDPTLARRLYGANPFSK